MIEKLLLTLCIHYKTDGQRLFYFGPAEINHACMSSINSPPFVLRPHNATLVNTLLWTVAFSRQLTEAKVDISLFPCVKIWLHHIHEVFGGSVPVAWHVHDGESFSHFEEVHLLCVTLQSKHREKGGKKWQNKLYIKIKQKINNNSGKQEDICGLL